MNGGSLSILGLDITEERAYRHFLRNPGTGTEDIGVLLHSPREEVERALARLDELGLLRTDEHGGVSAAAPETAVERLTEIRLRELHEQ
ncbi:helix-turn-helix transcriptional regulator, partial [Streptomyces sp. SID7982]|nr:helix-turn-helix transcriptional regulator [Streptomyces sp. SID7982]